MEYPTSNMNSGQSAYSSHPQDTTRISPGCNPQSNPSTFPSGDTGPHGRGYSSYPPAYQTTNEFGGPGHTASNPPTYPHVYPPEGHGQSLTLNQLLQQGSTPNSYPPRPHGGPPMQASYRVYEHYPYGYKSGMPGGVGERPQHTQPLLASPKRSNDGHLFLIATMVLSISEELTTSTHSWEGEPPQ
ncbi:AT-rich interactive domain-containing protein 1 [Fasciola gigantica]|uniref:AT-rich interactive domain-containing protein 1 n=1 Tax=Fasciola gigantica TaxID=46835 RepID=A0A504YKY6_FASGI|nr:AT-rich interactive domain-containing protein 1 [Fasciola gigantica]